MTNYSDFDLDLQNTSVNGVTQPNIAKLTTLYSKLSCPSQPWLECISIVTPVTNISQKPSCACAGVSNTDKECSCPPKDYGTLDVCLNSNNNNF